MRKGLVMRLSKLLIAMLGLIASQVMTEERIYPVVYAQENSSIPVQTLWLEAGGEGLQGMIAVGEVIRERARASQDNFTAVCMKRYQFSCWNALEASNTKLRLDNMTGADWQLAAKAWEESKYSNWTKGATMYANLSICKPRWDWKKVKKVAKVGQHTFYKEIK